MAIEVDKMMYSKDCDDELMFQYLYHLAYILSVKGRYFTSMTHYDNFAIEVATRVYLRIKNKK